MSRIPGFDPQTVKTVASRKDNFFRYSRFFLLLLRKLIWYYDSLMVTAISNGRSEDRFSAGEEMFIFAKMTRLALSNTQPVFQWPKRGALPASKAPVA
jgi:hypothetical protein